MIIFNWLQMFATTKMIILYRVEYTKPFEWLCQIISIHHSLQTSIYHIRRVLQLSSNCVGAELIAWNCEMKREKTRLKIFFDRKRLIFGVTRYRVYGNQCCMFKRLIESRLFSHFFLLSPFYFMAFFYWFWANFLSTISNF